MSLLNTDYAVYLPAVNNNFPAEVLKPLSPNRPFPAGLNVEDLIFWNRSNKLWHYSHILHSVGLHTVGSQPDNAVTRAGKTDCFLLGDSGGFQIGQGTLKGLKGFVTSMGGDKAETAWADAYSVKKWIVDWLELHTDYAMTVDMPLWATLPKGATSPFHQCSISVLTAMTVDNLRFIDTHRQGRTRWLNVIQGLDEQSMLAWWQAVKWFDCSGYALAGAAGVKGGISNVLKILLTMRDDGALTEGHNWIHVLGVSTPKWAILLSAIQRTLRKSVNPLLQISYDSATPFQAGSIRDEVALLPEYTSRPRDWAIQFERVEQSAKLAGSTEPFPYSSPIGDRITMGDLNVRGGDWDQRSFDNVSNALLCNHNCWVLLRAFELANEMAFASDGSHVPAQWRECLSFIDSVFEANDWQNQLDFNKKLLAEIEQQAR
jgi:hypothetical protein